MMQEFSAATLEAAKQMAAESFGVPISELKVTVLEEPKAGLFGLFGKKSGEYKISAEYSADTAEPLSEDLVEKISSPSVSREILAAANEITEDETVPEMDADESSDSAIDPVMGLEKMQIGAEYLEKVLAKMYPDIQVEAQLGENGVEINLVGEDAGKLIGRRGETLDALQYLTSMVANRGDRDYLRIAIDTCGYREKRQKALQELAQRICKSVLRTGRSVSLEPMNPYERRIIHSTVTAIEGVSSHSSGEEPNRKVIITSDNPQPARGDRRGRGGNRERGDRNDRGNRGGRNDRERRPSGEGPRKLDLSTSFEKDYKRPKPEDSLNAGVYGKIEID